MPVGSWRPASPAEVLTASLIADVFGVSAEIERDEGGELQIRYRRTRKHKAQLQLVHAGGPYRPFRN
ncbi:hypothetical protein NXC12_PC00109 (plasmid) [Rhizobium etli]|uniref:Uncharacterized protein n=1 Tax=Rhizobium etli TaxID=29449 RepID=A0AAN1EMA0_RHIET|nr:hypothetical protein REMIM1_PD00109 [Rhizobium etli bv. mimosae str. Mim1]ARQ12749.1 hypothetical protein NXC12_PC00109 [Rhizobium etli]